MILQEEDLELFNPEETETVIYQPTLLDYFQEDSQPLYDSVVLLDDPRWDECLEYFASTKKIAFDLETYGAEPWHPLWHRKSKIRLIQVGLTNGLCMIADLGGWTEVKKEDYKNRLFKKYGSFLSVLKDKLFDYETIIIGANLKFDSLAIRQQFGFILRQPRDLTILSQVYWAGAGVEKAKSGENRSERCKMSHSLKAIAERFGYEMDKTSQSSNWGWNLSNSQLNYAADDVLLAIKIFDDFRPLIVEAGLAFTAFTECNCVSVFAEMEFYGMPVDLESAKLEVPKYEEKIQHFVDIFEKDFPGVLWTSNSQVLEAFQAGIENFKDLFGPEDKPSVSAEILHQVDHPAAKALLEARKLSTGLNNIKGYIQNSYDGRIRGVYRQIASGGMGRSTCSGQMSVNRRKYSIGAQLQNPPNAYKKYKGVLRGVRELVKAPPGYKLIVADAAQAHMRIAAQVSGDELLLKIFNDDFDGHSILAGKLAQLSGLPWSAEFISGTLGKGPRDSNWIEEAKQNFTNRQNFKDAVVNEKGEDITKEVWFDWVKGQAKTFRSVGKTMIYSCVPLSTQCFTKEGWVGYSDLKVGDEILGYNEDLKTLEWTPVLEKFIYKDSPVIDWRVGNTKSFKSTPNHRWISETGVFTTEEFSPERYVVNTAKLEFTEEEEAALRGYFSSYVQRDLVSKDVLWFQSDDSNLRNEMQLSGYLLGYNPVVQGNVVWFSSEQSTKLEDVEVNTLPNQDVWCVRTKLSTWVIKDYETNYITITGNSLNGSTKGRIYQELISTGFTWATMDSAAELVKFFNESYPDLVKYIKSQYQKANDSSFSFRDYKTFDGYPIEGDWGLVTTLTGRRVFLKKYPNKFRNNELQVSYTDCTAANWLPVESDLIKSWLVGVYNSFCDNPHWDAHVCNVPHDEGNFLCLEEHAEEVAIMIYEKMKEVFNSFLTRLSGVEEMDPRSTICDNWSEK